MWGLSAERSSSTQITLWIPSGLKSTSPYFIERACNLLLTLVYLISSVQMYSSTASWMYKMFIVTAENSDQACMFSLGKQYQSSLVSVKGHFRVTVWDGSVDLLPLGNILKLLIASLKCFFFFFAVEWIGKSSNRLITFWTDQCKVLLSNCSKIITIEEQTSPCSINSSLLYKKPRGQLHNITGKLILKQLEVSR